MWIASTVFVRFEFEMPVEQLRARLESGKLFFVMVNGGLFDWFILSSWCRNQGFADIQIANRKRILFLSKPVLFLKVLFRRTRYAELFLSDAKVPRLLCLSGRERKRINVPTESEKLLAEIYTRAAAAGTLGSIEVVPVLIVWRRHTRGAARAPSEYLLGLSSKPNWVGKLWYLFRRRTDSRVTALETIPLVSKERLEKLEGFDETEAMRAGKSLRRRVLVSVASETRVLLGPRYHSPSLIKESVLRDPEVQSVITEIAQLEGVDRKKVMSRAYGMLTEIVADYRYRFVEVMYVFLTWLFSKVFDGMSAKDEEWQKIREIMKTKPVAFVPCHRSHFDYLVIPYLLFVHDMVVPHIAAGVNLSFWPVGNLLRRGGAFFIRRSFRGDKLYQTIVNKYVQTLLQNRYNLKFFIEGTRSRSGKMLAPAYGMLKMVMQSYEDRICEDVVLVPVSICYDEVPEQGSYSKELGGGPKVKESALELIKSRNVVSGRFGKVYARVAPPISVRDMYNSGESDPRLRLQKTAFQVCKSICDVTPITPKSLVSTVMLCHRNPLLSLEEVLRLSLWLGGYVQYVGLELSTPLGSLRPAVEQTLRRLRKGGVLLEVEDVPRRYVCESRKRALLNFYKNNASHCLVIPSIAVLAYYRARQKVGPSEKDSFEAAFKAEALQLRDLLKFEFFFSPRAAFLEELEHSAEYFFGSIKGSYVPEQWARQLRERVTVATDLSVLTREVGEILESYLCFADFIRQSSDTVWEKRSMMSKVLKYSENRQLQGEILFPESLSLVNYGNALLYLENQGMLRMVPEGEKTMVHRERQLAALGTVIDQLTEYRDLMQEKEEAFMAV